MELNQQTLRSLPNFVIVKHNKIVPHIYDFNTEGGGRWPIKLQKSYMVGPELTFAMYSDRR